MSAALWHLAGEAVAVFLGCIQRDVRCAICDVEEEGLLLVTLDERGGSAAASVNVIHLRWQVFHAPVLAIERDVGGEWALGVLGEDVFEAVRGNLRRPAEVPLAELRGGIAGILQARGDGGFLVEACEVLAVVVHVEAALELADHQSGSRGHALRRGAVTVLGQHAAASERIHMRRLDVRDGTLDAEVRVAVVVRVKDDDVRLG